MFCEPMRKCNDNEDDEDGKQRVFFFFDFTSWTYRPGIHFHFDSCKRYAHVDQACDAGNCSCLAALAPVLAPFLVLALVQAVALFLLLLPCPVHLGRYQTSAVPIQWKVKKARVVNL